MKKRKNLNEENNVDTTQTITHIGLCAGYGGIELGLKRVLPTMRTVALCEIEAFAIANLVAKMEAGFMDPAPIWTNLKTFPWEEFRDKVDVLSGGYPCQPFSAAGKRLGTDDPRHLWPYIASGIRLLRPKLCFFENVEGHISLGLREVIADLESLGYETTWGIFSAAECGAPHQRKRVFIMAHLRGSRLQGDITRLLAESGWQESSGSVAGCSGSSGSRKLADSNSAGSGQNWQSSQSRPVSFEQSSCTKGGSDAAEVREGQAWPARPGQPQHAWEPPRVVGNAQGRMSGQSSTGDWRESAGRASEAAESLGNAESGNGQWSAQGEAGHAAQPDESMGDTENERCGGLDDEPSQTSGREARGHADGTSTEQQQEQRQTQPTLGGDADGAAGGLDYAELCVSCDNRTDELRLLGNGVVPATAELAFRTLFNELH